MYLRFFGRLLDANNALLYAAPFPLDSGSVSLFLAAFAADMTPGASVLVNSFEVDDVFADRYSRLNAVNRTAADIGKVYHQQSDDSYWKLTAIGPPLAYDAFLPVAPALPGGAAGGGSGGGSGGGGGGVAAAVTLTPDPNDAGGGQGGIATWADGGFPAYVQPAFLHASNWTYTINVPAAGRYKLTGDCATNSNMPALTATVGGVVGAALNLNTPAPGGIQGADFGTFQFAAGMVPILFTQQGATYNAVKTIYLTPA